MKINIITYHSFNSFGGVLQTFAIQAFLSNLGNEVGIFDYKQIDNKGKSKTFRGKVSYILKKLIDNKRIIEEQNKKFDKFRKDNLILNYDTECDVFISGSDQIWNAGISFDPMFFLSFLDKKVCKASYAASMLTANIPKEKEELVSKYLNDYDLISVREPSVKECIKKYTNTPISINIDPTLLHCGDFYENYATPVKDLPKRYILAYILHIPKNGNKILKWLKKEQELDIVLLDNSGQIRYFLKNDFVVNNAGPSEFLWLFKNAQSVVTTSFHGVCYSLIFEKEFYPIVNPASPARITDLLRKFDMEPLKESNKKFRRNININWKHVREVLQIEREKSIDYINRIGIKLTEKSISYEFPKGCVDKLIKKCTGCGACEAVCPVSAIQMVLNKRGFYEPKIDYEKCTKCGKCMRKCPLNIRCVKEPLKAYYGWHKDSTILFNSSSGGAFHALADKMLKENGVVIGAVYSDDFRDVIFRSNEEISVDAFKKSKYTVSRSSDIYPRIKKYLDDGRKVLFTGTPCQCAGIKSVFGDNNDNLILVDFVCGGMPSLLFFREHIEMLEKRYSSKITNWDFRPKNWKWGRYHVLVNFSNGRTYKKIYFGDSYFKLFINKASVRSTCDECPYYHYHRSDITIADFWGYERIGIKKHNEGMSMIICNTNKGQEYFSNTEGMILKDLDLINIAYTVKEKIPNEQVLNSQKEFFELSETIGFEKAASQLYDFNEFKHYFRRMLSALHLK